MVGIGSGNTWLHSPHDGQFYAYNNDLSNLISSDNPQPHAAQYYGTQAAGGDGFFVVAEDGNLGSWNTETAITVYSTYDNTIFEVFRNVFVSSGTGGSRLRGLTATRDHVIGSYWLETEQEITLYVRPVLRDANDAVIGLGSPVSITEASSSPAAHLSDAQFTPAGGFAAHGNFIAIGRPGGSAANGTGEVQLLTFDETGIQHIATITPPVLETAAGFGRAIDFDGTKFFVSAPEATTTGTGTGAIYVYDVADQNTFTSPTVITSDQLTLSTEKLGERLKASGGVIVASVGEDAIVRFTVAASIMPPTLDELSDVTILEDATEQTVYLTGITDGGGETQSLLITAVSDNPGVIPDPTITYYSPESTGILAFTPIADQSGTATR